MNANLIEFGGALRFAVLAALTAFALPGLHAQNPNSFSLIDITPEAVDAAVAQMDGVVADVMSQTGVPGMAVAIVYDDEVVYAKGFGVKQIGSPDPVDENTVFQIASLSKSISGTVVAGVVGDGDVEWDTPVAAHYPGFELSDPYLTEHVTIGDFFSHRSGLPGHAGDLLEDLGYSREEIISRLHHLPLRPLRGQHLYTNFGLTVAAVAAANAAGQTWEDLCETRLFDRIDMDSASMRYADFVAHENKALGNVILDDDTWVATPQQRDPDAQAPAGGVSANVLDMAKWMRLILGGGEFEGETIIKTQPLLAALSAQSISREIESIDERGSFYGFGFGTGADQAGRVRLKHSGAFLLGTGTNFQLLPSEGLGVVVLTNGTPVGAAEAVSSIFFDLVENGAVTFDWTTGYETVFKNLRTNHSRLADSDIPLIDVIEVVDDYPAETISNLEVISSVLAGREFPANPAPAPAAENVIGHYNNPYFGELEVLAGEGTALEIRLGPDQTAYPLPHFDGETYAWFPPGENGVGISAVDFNFGEAELAESVTFEFLNEHGLGVFVRQNYPFGAYMERQPGSGGEGWIDDKRLNGVANGLEYAFARDASTPFNDIDGPAAIARRARSELDGDRLAVRVDLPVRPPEEVIYTIYAGPNLDRDQAEVLAYYQSRQWIPVGGQVQTDTPEPGVDSVWDHVGAESFGSRFIWLGVRQAEFGGL